ncbi:MAG: hypothetical protein ACXAEU_23200 [Candidatus Hodarchaeales archaeon]
MSYQKVETDISFPSVKKQKSKLDPVKRKRNLFQQYLKREYQKVSSRPDALLIIGSDWLSIEAKRPPEAYLLLDDYFFSEKETPSFHIEYGMKDEEIQSLEYIIDSLKKENEKLRKENERLDKTIKTLFRAPTSEEFEEWLDVDVDPDEL